MSTEPALTVTGGSVVYRTRRRTVVALQSASITVPVGASVGLVGESGSGKSTLARLAAGLIEPSESVQIGGDVEIGGREMRFGDRRAWDQVRGSGIGMMFQDPLSYLNPVVRVDRQILEGLRAHRPGEATAERVFELLEMVRLSGEVARSYPHELSGGMRQRVLLAMALSCRPNLLIADEPTTALDVSTQDEIIDLLEALRSALGMALLLITHDIGVVAELCARVNVMYGGRIVEAGRTDDVLARPGHPYTVGLLRSAAVARGERGEFATIPGDVPVIEEIMEQCMFADRCEHVRDVCRTGVPPTREIQPGSDHVVACTLWDRSSAVPLVPGERA